MKGFVHRMLYVLLLSAAWGTAWGQGEVVDTCINFDEYEVHYPNTMPTGWTLAHAWGDTYSYASVYFGGLASANRLYFCSLRGVVLSTPDLGDDLNGGYWLQCSLMNNASLGEAIVEVGAMSDVQDTGTFVVLTTVTVGSSWKTVTVDLSPLPDGYRHVAFRHYSGGSVYSFVNIDNVKVSRTPCQAWDFHMVSFDEDSVVYAWEEVGEPEVRVELLGADSTVYVLIPEGQRMALPVGEGGRRQVRLVSQCEATGASSCADAYTSVWMLLPQYDPSDCASMEILYTNRCTPYYGTFNDPYQVVGAVDEGEREMGSRHTVCRDTAARDPNVPALRCVPEGDSLSVRLGNWQTGAQAEAMSYMVTVDTNERDMLILRYAAVLEDPNHTAQDQPRFRIEMLDSAMNLIAPARCNSYDFVANEGLGWNTISVSGETILWKDWTTVGIDLSQYHGQTVQLRLTTFDCSEGGHFGYAYYTLACAKKTMNFISCTSNDSVLVEAPEGFAYSWRRDDLAGVVLGTGRSKTLPLDNHVYYCDLGFIGDATCSVTMCVRPREIAPLARFDYELGREDCRFKLSLKNRSGLVDDSLYAGLFTRWLVDDSLVSRSRDCTLQWTEEGQHTVRLVSSLDPDGGCADTATDVILLRLQYDTLEATICQAESYAWGDSLLTQGGLYTLTPHCDSVRTLRLTVLDTTLRLVDTAACIQMLYLDSLLTRSGDYDFVYTNAAGCDSTYRLQLTVHPQYDTLDTLRVCPPGPYVYHGVDYGGEVDVDVMLSSQWGCDSLVHLRLETQDSLFALRAAYSLDGGRQWTDSLPIVICSNQQLLARDSSTAVRWQWSVDSGQWPMVSGPQASFDFQRVDSIAFTTLQMTATSPHGCQDSLRWPVVLLPLPRADFDWYPDLPVDIAPETQFNNLSQPLDECSYLWLIESEPGSDARDSLTLTSPFYRWPGDLPTGDFEVELQASVAIDFRYDTLTLSHVCTDTARRTVTIVTALLQFPNLVTPNGDGVNDRWEVVNLLDPGLYSMNELWIYSRWGDLVYHVRNIHDESQFWDPDAPFCPDGTYYYRFSAKSLHGLIRRNGTIEVVR
ncbi:MAG: gliding motility-associated C-terminal domain-containing protein [Bacteroidales bacterium]|nr:gliding motility-associated C-terminal domain-containing protein [Bacteroidales bacterium]